MNEDLLKISQYLKYYKVFRQGEEAAIQRYSIKRIFKNCTKFTGKTFGRNLSFNKVKTLKLRPATLFKKDFITGVFL